MSHPEPNKQEILPSDDQTVAEPLTKVIPAQYFYVCASLFRRKAIENHWFDENLAEYYGEDVDFTCKLPNLYLTPHATSEHNHHDRSDVSITRRKIMAHELYLFNKNQANGFIPWAAYFWHYLGKLSVVFLTERKSLSKFIADLLWTAKHNRQIRKGICLKRLLSQSSALQDISRKNTQGG